MTFRVLKVLALAAVAVVGAGTVAAQEAEPTSGEVVGGLTFVDEVDVTVVNVDVSVRDRDGRPVEGLGVDDFRVFQNGVEMPISHFVELDEEVIRHRVTAVAQQAAAAVPETVEEAPELPEIKPVWVVLFVDHENLKALDRNRVLRRVREFVAANLDEPVQMMVASYQRSLQVKQPFTSDSREVTAALRDMTMVTGGRDSRESARRELLRDIQEAVNRDHGSEVNTQEGARLDMRQRVAAYAAEESNELSLTLGALRQVVAMLSGIEGRKSLIYISSGLPMTPGIGLMHEYAMTFRDQSILSLRGRYDGTRLYHGLVSMANAQEVSLYAIDASGLETLGGYDADAAYARDPTASSIGEKDYQASLRYMADGTGGLAVVNTNDVAGGLERISDDLFNYYSLGYTTNVRGEDRVHRIDVELTGKADYDLRFRRRFVEKSIESRVQDRVFTSLMVEVDDNPMALELAAGESAPGSGSQWLVPVHLSVPLDKLVLVPEGDELVARMVVFLGSRDEDGRSSEVQRQEHELRVPAAELEAARSRRFGLDFRLILDEGRQRLSVGVLDPISRQASYTTAVVTVP